MDHILFQSDKLKNLVSEIFIKLGATEDEAISMSDHLVGNNLVGHDSHGVIRVLAYEQEIKKGNLKLNTYPETINKTRNTITKDANFCMGPVAGKIAVEEILNMSKDQGVAAVSIRNAHHLGRIGAYTAALAEKGMIGIAFPNDELNKHVAPFGGREGRLSTNPISFASPRGKEYPFVVDFATSAVAEGKIIVARNRNEKLLDNYIINKNGSYSNVPADYFDGGALLPLGGTVGYKGFALSLIVEILGGILSENKKIEEIKNVEETNTGIRQGLFLMAVNIESFLPLNKITHLIETFFDDIKNTPKQKNVEEILIPGELEYRKKKIRLKEGISIENRTWEEMKSLALKLNVNPEI